MVELLFWNTDFYFETSFWQIDLVIDCETQFVSSHIETASTGSTAVKTRLIQLIGVCNLKMKKKFLPFYSQSVFEIPQVPFAFEFESERPNGKSAIKQSPNYHSSDLDKVKLPNGNLETKQSLNCHLAVRPTFPNLTTGNSATVLPLNSHSAIQTQTQTEPEAYRMHQSKVLLKHSHCIEL